MSALNTYEKQTAENTKTSADQLIKILEELGEIKKVNEKLAKEIRGLPRCRK